MPNPMQKAVAGDLRAALSQGKKARAGLEKVWGKERRKPGRKAYLSRAIPTLLIFTPEVRSALELVRAHWEKGEAGSPGAYALSLSEVVRELVLQEAEKLVAEAGNGKKASK